MSDPALLGRRIVTTRDAPGRLDSMLSALGAEVVHVPLIEVVDTDDPAFAEALGALAEYDWVVVTSRHGAARVAPALRDTPSVATAAVGAATAAELRSGIGRLVDVVPERQTAADLVEAMPVAVPGCRALAALADRAAPTLVEGLRARGYTVDAVVAYRTLPRRPSDAELDAVRAADAVVFASGSAAEAWAETCGSETPPHVIAIGPTTADAARASGLGVTAVAADHSIEGLVAEVTSALGRHP